jgi:hypothetical protein
MKGSQLKLMLDIYFSSPPLDSTNIQLREIYKKVYTGSVDCVRTREQWVFLIEKST